MRKRLLLLVTACNVLLLIVLAVSLLPLTKSQVLQKEESEFRAQFSAVATYLAHNSPTAAQTAAFLTTVDTVEGRRIGVYNQDGAIGRDAARFAGWPLRRPDPKHLVVTKLEVLNPLLYSVPNGDRIATVPVSDGVDAWIIEGTITAGHLAAEERTHWIRIASYYLIAFVASLLLASLLARGLVRPVQQAVTAAEAIGRSEPIPYSPARGPREVVSLGRALQTLSRRIQGLLAGEREHAAHLSHSLRTPLTVLALEVNRLQKTSDLDLRQLTDCIVDLEQSLDDVITQSRQSRSNGNPARCDAGEVLRKHLANWSRLAVLQGREAVLDIPAEPIPVALSASDLGNVIDVLVSNVFRHTEAGLGYRVIVESTPTVATIEIVNKQSDMGAGLTGSSGLGLQVARTPIEAAGGTFDSRQGPDGGWQVRFTIPAVQPL